MAKNDYTVDAQDAQELIDEFGGEAKLLVNTKVLIDPEKPQDGYDPIDAEHDTFAVLIPMSNKDKVLFPAIAAIKTVSYMYVEAVLLSVVPIIGNRVQYEGNDWLIENVTPLKPAGVNVMYTLVVSL